MVQCTFKINDILQLVCHTLYIPITRAFILFPQTPPLSLSLSHSLFISSLHSPSLVFRLNLTFDRTTTILSGCNYHLKSLHK